MSTKDKKITEIKGLGKIDPNGTYRFELVGNGKDHKGSYLINSVTKVWDEEKGITREVRLSNTEESPFVDEQSETARATTQGLKFVKGKLSLSGREAYKIRYLMVIDNNVANENIRTKPTFRYKLIDDVANAQVAADRKKKVLKIQSILADATTEELSAFLKAEYNFTPKTETHDELFVKASAYAEKDPDFVIANFNTEETKLKSLVTESFRKQTIKQVKNPSTSKVAIIWGDTDTEIHEFDLSDGTKITDAIMAWIDKGTKEANAFVKKLQTK